MKIGDKVDLDKCKATVMSIDRPPGFSRKSKVILRVEFDLEELEHELNKKSKRRVAGKKKKTS